MAAENSWIAYGVPLIVVGSLLVIIILIFAARVYVRGPMYRGTARDVTGQTVVITGGNTGIGKYTARDLARRGAKVIILCRDMDKGKAAAEELSEDTGKTVSVRKLDLASLESVRECAALLIEEEPKIHILINNAGVMLTPQWQTKEGFEMQLGTNHYGHFLLTLLLMKNIKAAAPSRIINVSSLAHVSGSMNWEDLNLEKSYNSLTAYSQSKLANILFTKSLAKKLLGTGVTTYALHPGVVDTELVRHVNNRIGSTLTSCFSALQRFMVKDVTLGAQTTIACAVDEKLGEHSGNYYSDCKEKTPSSKARNGEDAERLWKISLKAVNLESYTI